MKSHGIASGFVLLILCAVAHGQQTLSVAGTVFDLDGKQADNIEVMLLAGKNGGELGRDKTNKFGVYNIVVTKKLSSTVTKLSVAFAPPNGGMPHAVEIIDVSNGLRQGKPEPLKVILAAGALSEDGLSYGLTSIAETERVKFDAGIQTEEGAKANIDEHTAELLARYVGPTDPEDLKRIADKASSPEEGTYKIDANRLSMAIASDRYRESRNGNDMLAKSFLEFVHGKTPYRPEFAAFANGTEDAAINKHWIASEPSVRILYDFAGKKVSHPERPYSIVFGGGDFTGDVDSGTVFKFSGKTMPTVASVGELADKSPSAKRFILAQTLMMLDNYPEEEKEKLKGDLLMYQPLIIQ